MNKNFTSFLIIFFITVYSSLVFCAGLNKKDTRYPLREYRKFILPNQMKVILISDPTLQRGSASMTVALGSMNDPEKSPGLAHFIEHMLFLGTEKYPEEGGYQKFISTHDGFSNAYTAEDRTNYHFEIDSNYLEEALDRFSQFFISPLFKNELLQREIIAIDEEHSKNISNDYRRILQVRRKAFSEDHPARHFANGTIETLKNVTREELISFYKKYYSSNQMMLAVAGPQNMELLQDLVVNRFNKIKNNKVLEKVFSSKFMLKDPRFRLMQIKTIKDLRLLRLVFPLTKTLHHYKSRPLGMLGFLIGHEGSGSLLSLLKKDNLASGLAAGVGISNKSFSSFEINIQLTKKGIKNYKRVIEKFFQYINLLRKKGLPKYVFEEVKLMSNIEYNFAEKEEGASLVKTFSTLMMYYPMRNVEISPYLITEYKPRIFDSLLYNLTPDNMLAILAFRDAKTDEKEDFFSAEYSIKYNNSNLIKKWKKIKPHPYLKLPEKNEFLPKRLEIFNFKGKIQLTYQSILGLKKEGVNPRVIEHLKKYQGITWESLEKLITGISPLAENEETLKHFLRKHVLVIPHPIIDGKFTKFWFQQDLRFKKPKAKLILRINSPVVYTSPRNAVLTQLYVDVVREGLNEFGYPVRLSGLDFNISYSKKGIILSFSGFSDKILDLAKSIVSRLKNININHKTFKILKEIRSRKYKNFVYEQPFKQAFYFRNLLLEGKKYSIMEYEKEINQIKLNHLEEFLEKLFKNIFIEGLAYGNLNPKNVTKTINELSKNLGIMPLAKTKYFTNTVRQISSGNSHTFVRKMLGDNSAVLIEFQMGQNNPKLLAKLMIIEVLLKAEFYNNIRTKKQLGYIVDSSMTNIDDTLGLMFLIQSNDKNSETLKQSVDVFLGNFYFFLKDISNFEINKVKKSIISSKLQKTITINAEANRIFNIIFDRKAEFDINSAELKALEKINHKDLLQFYGKYLLPSSQRKLILRMMSKKNDHSELLEEDFITIENFKEKYECPSQCLPQ